MKVIVYTRPDGGLSVERPAIPEYLEECFSRIPKTYNPIVIDDALLPKDRTDRNAWMVSTGVVSVDQAKASILRAASSSVAKGA